MKGQSAVVTKRLRPTTGGLRMVGGPPRLAVFATDLGWFGLSGAGRTVGALTIGHASPENARAAVARLSRAECTDEADGDWFPDLRRRLERFARGEAVDFRDVEVALPPMTAFQQAIVEATRRIPYGQTLSYAEVALRAGSPRAARAVGNVMAANRVPIIIPCHRVVASAGGLGGFSAPQGIGLKRRMLELEAASAK